MPVQFTAGHVVGLALCVTGFLVVFAVMARHGGMAFGFAAWRNMGAMMRDPEARGSRRLLWTGIAVGVLGGLVTCGSIAAGDAKKHQACRGACEAAGFENGRVRGDPYGRPGPRTVYSCWCRRGGEWSTEPLVMPEEPGATY